MIVMNKKITTKVKRRLFLLSSVLLSLIVFLFLTVFQDWNALMQNKKNIRQMNSQYINLLEEENALSSEIIKLQDPDYVARYAREKYMYSLPDEIIIRIPSEKSN